MWRAGIGWMGICGVLLAGCVGGADDSGGGVGPEPPAVTTPADPNAGPTGGPSTGGPVAPAPTVDAPPPPEPPPVAPEPPETMVPCAEMVTVPTSAPGLPTPHYALDFDDRGGEFAARHATTADADAVWVAGRRGEALHLRSGVLTLPFAEVIHPNQGSLSLWVATERWSGRSGRALVLFNTDNPVTTAGTATGADFALLIGASPQSPTLLSFYAGSPPAGDALTMPPITTDVREWGPGEWHHAAVTWTVDGPARRYRLYLDGRLIGQRRSTQPLTQPALPSELYLTGTRRSGWKSPAHGDLRVDTVHAYAVALTPHEVQRLYQADVSSGPAVIGGRAELRLAGPADGFGLTAWVDHASGEARTMTALPRALWQLHLVTGSGATTRHMTLNNTSALQAQLQCTRGERSGTTVLRWAGLPLPDAAGVFPDGAETVDVTVTLTPSVDAVTGRIQVDNRSTTWDLVEVVFPRFTGIAPPHGKTATTELVLTGLNIGSLQRDPFTAPHLVVSDGTTNTPMPVWTWSSVYPSGDLPMPWFGVYDAAAPTGGLYAAVHDPHGHVRTFQFRHVLADPIAAVQTAPDAAAQTKALLADPALRGLDVDVSHPVRGRGAPGNDYAPDWQAVFGVVDGDWYALAQPYRAYVTSGAPDWMHIPALSSRPDLPLWLANAGMVQSTTTWATIKQLTAEQDALGLSDTGLVYWHFNAWQDTTGQQTNDIPVTHSVRTDFVESLQSARSVDVPVTLYTYPGSADLLQDHGAVWGQTWSSKVAAALSAWQHDPAGAVAARHDADSVAGVTAAAVGPPTQPPQHAVEMCLGVPAWRTRLLQAGQSVLQQAGSAAAGGSGVQGFYVDVMERGMPRLCYAANHGHAPGDPATHVTGYRTWLTALRSALHAVQPQGGFTTEGFADPYLDLIDGHLVEYLPWWERQVPVAMAVYHDYTQFLGHGVYATSHTLAAMVAWQNELLAMGGMPGFAQAATSMSATDVALRAQLLRLAGLRRRWKAYLVFGRMLPPPILQEAVGAKLGTSGIAPAPPTQTAVPVTTVTQSIYAAPTSCKLSACTITRPAVLAHAWRSPSQRIGIVLASLELATSSPTGRTILVPLQELLPLAGTPPTTVRVHRRHTLATETVSLQGASAILVHVPRQELVLIELE